MNNLEARLTALEKEVESLIKKVNTHMIFVDKKTLDLLRPDDRAGMIDVILEDAMNGNEVSTKFLQEEGVLTLTKNDIDKVIDGLVMESENMEGR